MKKHTGAKPRSTPCETTHYATPQGNRTDVSILDETHAQPPPENTTVAHRFRREIWSYQEPVPQHHSSFQVPANPRPPTPHAAEATTRSHPGGKSSQRGAKRHNTRHQLGGTRLDLGKKIGELRFRRGNHKGGRNHPLETSAVVNPRSMVGATRSETQSSTTLKAAEQRRRQTRER